MGFPFFRSLNLTACLIATSLLLSSCSYIYGMTADGFLQNGLYAQAVDEYTKAIHERDKWEFYVGRGDAYKGLGKYKEAIDDYNQAMANNDDKEPYNIYFARAEAYLKSGRYSAAAEDYNQAMKNGRYKDKSYLNQG